VRSSSRSGLTLRGKFRGRYKDYGGSVVCPNQFPSGYAKGIIQLKCISDGRAAIDWLGAIEARLLVSERPALAVAIQNNPTRAGCPSGCCLNS